MKQLVTFLILLSSFSVFAETSEYCDASKKTVGTVEKMRFVELPYTIVQQEIIKILIADKCIKSRLSHEEISHLSELLLSYEYNTENASSIIGEFLAL